VAAPNLPPSWSHRGQRMRISAAENFPGTAQLGSLLCDGPDCALVLSSLLTSHCTFDKGTASVVQTSCATEHFLGKPRYDHIWYLGESGQRRLEWVRLVMRTMDGMVDDFAVVRRLVTVPSIPRYSLTWAGCTRMASRFDRPEPESPALAIVPHSHLLRVERLLQDLRTCVTGTASVLCHPSPRTRRLSATRNASSPTLSSLSRPSFLTQAVRQSI